MSQEARKIRFGLWYDFRNPPQWHQPADRLYRETLDQIAWGEDHGFDNVWPSEHHFIEDGYLPSIIPVAAAIGARTKRIRIASGVLDLPFHNPVRLAEDIAVVDAISGGRFEVGVGTGYKLEEFEGFGLSFKHRGTRTNESLEIIRRLLSGETLTFKSEFFAFENLSSRRSLSRNLTHRSGWADSRHLRFGVPLAMAMASLSLARTARCTMPTSPS